MRWALHMESAVVGRPVVGQQPGCMELRGLAGRVASTVVMVATQMAGRLLGVHLGRALSRHPETLDFEFRAFNLD